MTSFHVCSCGRPSIEHWGYTADGIIDWLCPTNKSPVEQLAGYNMIDTFRGDNRFLSNFWGCKVPYEGLVYPSSEHAFQAAKTLRQASRELIQAASSAANAKNMGRSVRLRPDWEAVKVNVMLDILRSKFSQEPLRSMLLATGSQQLIEGNTWHDNFWGACSCRNCQSAMKHNWLGQLLMQVREELQ